MAFWEGTTKEEVDGLIRLNAIPQSYKASLRESIHKLETANKQRPLTTQELIALEELYDKLDTHQTYLNESGMAYQG